MMNAGAIPRMRGALLVAMLVAAGPLPARQASGPGYETADAPVITVTSMPRPPFIAGEGAPA